MVLGDWVFTSQTPRIFGISDHMTFELPLDVQNRLLNSKIRELEESQYMCTQCGSTASTQLSKRGEFWLCESCITNFEVTPAAPITLYRLVKIEEVWGKEGSEALESQLNDQFSKELYMSGWRVKQVLLESPLGQQCPRGWILLECST